MTLPSERAMAVLSARQLLLDLLDSKKTPRVPRSVRMSARNALKHYPVIALAKGRKVECE